MQLANGDVYEGDWLDDHIHGIGTFTRVNGDIYTGEWVNDTIQGKGKSI